MRLRVNERFVSLQGEGLLVGTPSSFLRLTGCNLRCTWCDSERTSWSPQGQWDTVENLVAFCEQGPRHVVITGGEPLLQPNVAELSQRLGQAGHHVTFETAGTLLVEGLHCDLVSLSPKMANSTPYQRDLERAPKHEALRWQPEVVAALMAAHPWQLKFVVRAREVAGLAADLEEVLAMVDALPVPATLRQRVLLMPECIDPARLSPDYRALAAPCREHGFALGQRLHIAMFGHTPGT
ncbi:MAG: 7-carboxy-7-deazaguanine synthase QueE [Nannocystaceae bacterium]|nr:7-carboxy-7-deazaguanine synthase QueE [Nannocystaceae bacterium]